MQLFPAAIFFFFPSRLRLVQRDLVSISRARSAYSRKSGTIGHRERLSNPSPGGNRIVEFDDLAMVPKKKSGKGGKLYRSLAIHARKIDRAG